MGKLLGSFCQFKCILYKYSFITCCLCPLHYQKSPECRDDKELALTHSRFRHFLFNSYSFHKVQKECCGLRVLFVCLPPPTPHVADGELNHHFIRVHGNHLVWGPERFLMTFPVIRKFSAGQNQNPGSLLSINYVFSQSLTKIISPALKCL